MSSNLELRVKVLSTNPVANARVGLSLSKDGRTIRYLSGYTNSAGELAYLLKPADTGVYVLNINTLYKSLYVWDKSKGVLSGTYTLSR